MKKIIFSMLALVAPFAGIGQSLAQGIFEIQSKTGALYSRTGVALKRDVSYIGKTASIEIFKIIVEDITTQQKSTSLAFKSGPIDLDGLGLVDSDELPAFVKYLELVRDKAAIMSTLSTYRFNSRGGLKLVADKGEKLDVVVKCSLGDNKFFLINGYTEVLNIITLVKKVTP